jgi:hypothetical protein
VVLEVAGLRFFAAAPPPCLLFAAFFASRSQNSVSRLLAGLNGFMRTDCREGDTARVGLTEGAEGREGDEVRVGLIGGDMVMWVWMSTLPALGREFFRAQPNQLFHVRLGPFVVPADQLVRRLRNARIFHRGGYRW